MPKIQDIIKKYKDDLNSLCKNQQSKLELVINTEWDKIDENLKIIYCGDNPGKSEKKSEKYFDGIAGKEFKFFVKTHNKRLKVKSGEFIFFNKTPFYSNKTSQLTQKDDKNNLINKSINLTIDCLYQIWQVKNIPIVVFGVNERSYIVKTFKARLKDNKIYHQFLNDLTILNHPSHNSLFAAFGKFLIENFEDKEEIKSVKYLELINNVKKNWL